MADHNKVEEWKRQYGAVFSMSMRGVDYIFRELTFREYDEAFALPDEGLVGAEDHIVRCAILDPPMDNKDFDNMPAGIVSVLAEEILNLSGLGEVSVAKDRLDRERERAQHFRGLMKAFILATMPVYREEELDDMVFGQVAAKVALAEQIIRVNQAAFGIENEVTLDLIDPNEIVAMTDAEKAKHQAKKKPGQAGYNDPIADKLRSALG